MSGYVNNSQGGTETVFCPNCGKALSSGELFCGECGTARPSGGGNRCSRCGAEIHAGQDFCPNCGTRLGAVPEPSLNPAVSQLNQPKPKKKKKVLKIVLIVLLAIVVIFVGLVIYVNATRVDLEKLYDEYCDPTWAKIDPLDCLLLIDTNPYDWEDDGLAYPEAFDAIEEINEELGISPSFIDELQETRAIDGMQKREFDKITVAWRYHPDTGLEVFYTTQDFTVD